MISAVAKLHSFSVPAFTTGTLSIPGGFEFAHPMWLLAILALPLLWWLLSRPSSVLIFSSSSLLSGHHRSWKQRLVQTPKFLSVIGIACLFIALARPRTPDADTRVSREGIAIMMVLDRSSSMNARDLVPKDRSINRLDVVQEVFVDFVLGKDGTDGRVDDLVGLIGFAGYADSICPLTLDHANLSNLASELSIVTDQNEDGTAVGDALGLAVERLRRSKAKSRVAILLTDGVSNAGVIQPLKAADLAKQFDIKVYCIGAGTNGVAPIPMQDFTGRVVLGEMEVRIDEELLKEVASLTGGKYFRATDADSLASVYEQIATLERTEVTEQRFLMYTEHFPIWLQIGGGLLAISALTRSTLFRRLP
ncbi:MAG TPA: aerotolerance regulator BatA [Planctomycetaceae bacterium]|nr:aerotolerance regulator BatA [Planctomycetaceae bacterium]